MKYRYLGRSGLLVSRLCLGTMTFGNKDWGCDQEVSSGIVRTFVAGGGNFIDTADGYSGGESEKMLGVALKEHDRDALVMFPRAAAPGGGFNWELLIDVAGRRGPDRLEGQYYRANIDGSDHYVLSVAGSNRYRLKTDGSGVSNLFLTGDWIDCGLNAGCIEATVMAGNQCARAVADRAKATRHLASVA